ncbi:MAG: sporulation-control protein [Eubacteriales bacterium]|nr:sporulation-control protein [Eubacteriales bacterium]
MEALEKELGFARKRSTEVFNGRYQEFEYVPRGFMRGELDELDVIYHLRQDRVGLFMQVDRKARGLSGLLADALDLDERNVFFFISNAQLTTLCEVPPVLARVIEQECRKCF